MDLSKASPQDYVKLFENHSETQMKSARTAIVCSNAGYIERKKFLEQSPEALEMMIKTNVHPNIFLAK